MPNTTTTATATRNAKGVITVTDPTGRVRTFGGKRAAAATHVVIGRWVPREGEAATALDGVYHVTISGTREAADNAAKARPFYKGVRVQDDVRVLPVLDEPTAEAQEVASHHLDVRSTQKRADAIERRKNADVLPPAAAKVVAQGLRTEAQAMAESLARATGATEVEATATRHQAYRVHHDGTTYRHPFASFPHAEAARRWVANNDDTNVRFVPPLPEVEAAEVEVAEHHHTYHQPHDITTMATFIAECHQCTWRFVGNQADSTAARAEHEREAADVVGRFYTRP